MPTPRIQSVPSVPRKIDVEADPPRANDHTPPTNLMPPTFRIPLVSRPIIFHSDMPNIYQVSPKPPSPVSHERGFLKPPPLTMPGSLFPRSPSIIPDTAPPLQTPRTRRASNSTLSPTLGRTNATRTEVHSTMEDRHVEADISSGTLLRLVRCRLF